MIGDSFPSETKNAANGAAGVGSAVGRIPALADLQHVKQRLTRPRYSSRPLTDTAISLQAQPSFSNFIRNIPLESLTVNRVDRSQQGHLLGPKL